MNCPNCNAETAAATGECPVCGDSATSAPTVAAIGRQGRPLNVPPGYPDVTGGAGRGPVFDLTDAPTIAAGPWSSTEDTTGDSRVRPDVTGFDTTRLPTDDDPTALPGSGSPRDTTGPLVVGERFGPRYLIVRLLGMGGMGAVYQAWDGELDVVVALKVILPETADDPFATQAIERRFKQELLLARKVTHRNVVRIYDLGEIRGIKYITMSYLDGEDLATVLKRNGKLAVPEALKIMRHVAAGLLAAHDAGVVHRDLKPANIMIEGDNAVIMDFGIARASSGSGPVVPPPVAGPDVGRTSRYTLEATMAGSVVGTVAYMAPEQARGESVDHRADIYTWGLIMSDLLLGPRSLRGSVAEELQRRMTEAPPPLRSKDPQIPEALERIVSRSVMPDPAARYQTTAELVADLDRLDKNGKMLPLVRRLTPRLIAATAALVIAMLGGTYVLTRRAVEPPTQHEPVSMVIADFQNGTNDPTFDGTLEPMLRRALEGAGFISAFDRNGISRTLGVSLPDRLDETAAREIAVKQGLGVVLSGSIARQGNGYVVSVKTSQSVTGEEIASVSDRASNKNEVLEGSDEADDHRSPGAR